MVGYAASNIVDGFVDTVQWHEIDRIVENGGYLIDVREPNELKQGMIKGSINIPLDELRDRLDEVPVDKRNIYYLSTWYERVCSTHVNGKRI